jgi:hypothetical protein
MDNLWAQSHDTNLMSHGEPIKEFKFVPGNGGTYSKEQVYHRADALRLKLEEHHKGQYEMTVAVRDKTMGGWRSGKLQLTSVEEIFIWSPENYDKEFNIDSAYGDPDTIPELQAEAVVIYVRRRK